MKTKVRIILITISVFLVVELSGFAFVKYYMYKPFEHLTEQCIASIETMHLDGYKIDEYKAAELLEALNKISIHKYPYRPTSVTDFHDYSAPRQLFRITDKNGKTFDIGVMHETGYCLLYNNEIYPLDSRNEEYLISIVGIYDRISYEYDVLGG